MMEAMARKHGPAPASAPAPDAAAGPATDAGRDRERALVAGSGLFDAGFYSNCYREEFAAGESALDHFMRAGDARGYKPCPRFDPVLYRGARPDSRPLNSLAHFAAGQPRAGWRRSLAQWLDRHIPGAARMAERYWRVENRFPGLRMNQPPIPLLGDREAVRRNRAAARGYAARSEIRFDVDGRAYSIQSPEPAFLLERLRRDEPFAMPRLPQGFWDNIAMVDELAAEMRNSSDAALTDAEWRVLALRLAKELSPGNGGLEEHFIDEVLDCIPWHRRAPDYFRAVSFKGFPTCDELPFYYPDTGSVYGDRLRLLARYFTPDETLYDATLWKRWLISGALRDLPALCRPHPVLLIGPDLVGDIGSRWDLPRHVWLEIARENTQKHRHELLWTIAGQLATVTKDNDGRAPVVLFQCGGSLGFWLIARLYRRWPRVFYVDLGQVLNAWCYDRPENTTRGWNYLYLRNIIENTGLEAFYRRRMQGEFDALLERFL
jgi:hypothetical protein